MRKIYLISTLVLCTLISIYNADAQDFSNKGKDFWVAYGYHQVMGTTGSGPQEMVLYFAAEETTNVTVTIPGVGYTANYVVPANTIVTSTPIPKSGVQNVTLRAESTTPENKGINITSDKPIVAYAHIYNSSVSGATILFPKNTLGKEYYSVNYTNTSNTNNSNCWLYVIAADTGITTVEITPSAATINHAAGVPFTVNLTQGQVYNLMGQLTTSSNPFRGVDLTGTKVKSIASGNGSCKKIAVFSGSGRISITCNTSSSSSDNYMVQAFPQSAWGKKFLTTSSGGNQQNNIYRVCVSDPSTVVTLNGAPIGLPLQNNFYYEIAASTTPKRIEADKPIMVAQYLTSQGACGNGAQPGDPEVLYLSSVEQNINKVLWNATPNFAILQHYYNVIIPNTGTAISSFKLDGVSVSPALFVVHPQEPNYSYLTQSVTAGQHIIESDSGFNAIAYGYGNAESYGYNAGTNIKDIFQYVSVQNQHGTVNFPATCRNTPFFFSMTFPYQPTSIQWVFGPLLNAMGITDVTINSPVPTSTIIVAGKTLYVYQLPSNYTITASGTYPIKVIANNPTPDGCSGIQEIDFDVQVFDPPVADFNFTTNGCINSPVQFTDNSNTSGRPVISRYWNFNDPPSGPSNTSTIANPTHTYAAPGVYSVKYSLITDVGCLADTVIHTVNINELPVANFSSNAPFCVGKLVTFSDLSTVSGGATINKWTWNFGDGTPIVIASTGANQTHTYSTAGNYNVTLKVETTSGCQSLVFTLPITVYNNPVANFSLPTVCLPVGAAQFNDLSTYPPGSITGWSWNFGDGNTSTIQNPLHNYSGTGPFNVTLIATSNHGCIDTKIQSLTTVYAEPQAAFSAVNAVCLGGSVSFSDNSSAAGSTINGWSWNFGDGNTSTLQNPTHTYAATGSYTVTLNVTSAVGCQTVNNFATQNIVVRPLPTANITGNITVCRIGTSPLVTFTGANATAPYTFTYNINGGSNQTVTTTSGNSTTVSVPTTTAGTFIYNLISVQDGTSTACNQLQSGSVTVIVRPLPTASIAGTIAVCQNATSPNVTFTGAVGTAPYTFTYNINGGPNQMVTTTVGNSVTVTAPTNVAGTFAYNLISVQEGGANLCSQSQSGAVTITVNPLPTASITGTTEVCLNAAPSPNITFTGATSIAPYTFTYNLNGGANQTITTVSGNSITLPVPTNIAGTFVYNLIRVQDGSATSCNQTQTGSATVIVNPLPTRNFTTNSPACQTRGITFTDASTPNAGVINNWQWNFGDPASGPANISSLQNPVHIFATSGTYNVSLIVTTDKGCVSVAPTIPVIVEKRPLAGFIIPEVCLSDTYAQFTDTSKIGIPDNISAWQWIFGDPPSGPANTSILQNPQHSYSAVGSYNVQLIAISNKGCTDTIVQPLFINGSFPVAGFNVLNQSTLCANDSVSISEASTVFPGSITKVEIYWDNVNQPAIFDTDNFPVTGKLYKHKYPTVPITRTYTIRYRAYSGGVCVDDKLTSITVNAAPIVQFNAMPPACLDAAPFQITQASETGGVVGNGVFTGPGVSPTGIFNPAITGAGTFIIKYTFTATAGGCLDTISRPITVLDSASAQFTYSATVCEKTAVSFNSSTSTIPAASGTITGWNWNFGDPASGAANTSTLQNPTHIFSSWGNFNVTLSVITSNSCRSTNRVIPIFVNPIPRPNFTFPVSSCLPSANIMFTNTSSIPDGTQATFTYLWNFGDPASGALNTSSGSSPSHIYNAVGSYNINLAVTSGAGCIRDTTIILNTIHPQPTGSFNVNRDDICVGESFTFTDNSNPADGSTTQWNWTMGDGNTRTTSSFNYTYSTAGVFDVSLYITNSHGCRSSTFSKQVTVNAYPIVNAGPDLFILESGNDTINAVVTAINPTYLWTPNTYFLSSNTVQMPIVQGIEDITYTLTVTGRGNCIASDQVFIKVLKGPEIPNIFSPNGDGVHDKWIIKYLDTYPGGTVEIFNRYGQLIFRSVGYGVPWDGTINGKPVPIGTYYYIVNPKNGRSILSGYVDVIR